MQTMPYIWYGAGRSEKATTAEQQGKYPMYRAANILIKKAKPYYKLTRCVAKQLLIDYGFSGEWHHTGLYGKRTYYYNVNQTLKELGVVK